MDVKIISIPRFMPFADLRKVLSGVTEKYMALQVGVPDGDVTISPRSIGRMTALLEETGSIMGYSDFYDILPDGRLCPHPLIDYSVGSVRDDFDFGPLVFFRSAAVSPIMENAATAAGEVQVKFGAFYAFRLAASRIGMFLHVREFLYSKRLTDSRKSGEKQFDYVDPSNRAVQIEMERIVTSHLVETATFLPERVKTVLRQEVPEDMPTASVIIPVKNRAATILQAVDSALGQITDFRFNVMVVDNHSDDGTTDLLSVRALADPRLVHIIPSSAGLMIGGCWNEALFDGRCGRYAVQLDSDDVYESDTVLQRIVDSLRGESLAMVIGSYRLTDFGLNPIPPGVIDHREWSDLNGHNNALRINGLGAPRAFDTSVLKAFGGFPDVSYGEDYAVALRISREYRIGRIYDVLYDCRRWTGNSDAALTQEQINRHNAYKDMLRSCEMSARYRLNMETSSAK